MRSADDLLTAQELAEYLKVPVDTVYDWKYRGVGPQPIRVGRWLRYRWSDVQTWLNEQEVPA